MPLTIDKQALLKFDVAGPRYTSYPTAPEWSDQVGPEVYGQKLADLGRSRKSLSLYIHVPFCEQLCYFCACTKVIRPKEQKTGDEYIEYLSKEIDLVAAALNRRMPVKQLHWGGGTPTYLSEAQIERLFARIAAAFDLDLNGEVALEIDPRTVDLDKLKLLRRLGFNRVSMGVQDFDAKVQEDINRIQPFEQVKLVNAWCRRLGFASVNFDLIYGLPYQTKETFSHTVEQVISLKPDRIALYSFAYVPWLSKPQNKFNLEAVPVHDEKLDIFLEARGRLIQAGYEAIAMDHFALKTDEMARAFKEGRLHRNFMGYTLKPADEFLGLGVSAIGFLENTYVQNIKVLPEYYARLSEGRLPTERGKLLTPDDQVRQWVINRLMCAFELDKQAFVDRFGFEFEKYFIDEAAHVHRCVEDGLLTDNAVRLAATGPGRIFVRNICMGFDLYLRKTNGQNQKRFSRTV